MVACRSACNAGNATFTTVPSMKVIAEARMVATRVQRFLAAAFVTRSGAGAPREPGQILAVALSGA